MVKLKKEPSKSKYKNYRFEGIVKVISPISHSRGTESNVSELYTERFPQKDGNYDEVFVYKGNAMRGALRDHGMKYMCDKLNIKLPLKHFYSLFSGGVLEKIGDSSFDMELINKLRKTIPFLSVMGTAYGNKIIQGKLIVSPMIPICEETEFLYITSEGKVMEQYKYWEKNKPLQSWRQYFEVLFCTRTDDGKDEVLKRYITEDTITQMFIEQDGKKNKQKKDTPQQMLYWIETLSRGVNLFHKYELKNITEIELGAFVSALEEFSLNPYIGGQNRHGLGEVSMEYNKFEINAGNIMVDVELARAKEVYDDWLNELKNQYDKYLDQSEITKLLEAKMNVEED